MAVGGWFRSSLLRKPPNAWCKSHQRQWVDGSDPLYSESHPTLGANPTNGSWWMVQILSTQKATQRLVQIPPTAVGGWFRSFLISNQVLRWSLCSLTKREQL